MANEVESEPFMVYRVVGDLGPDEKGVDNTDNRLDFMRTSPTLGEAMYELSLIHGTLPLWIWDNSARKWALKVSRGK